MNDAAAAATDALRTLTAEAFDPLIGASLTLADDADGRLEVTLADVKRHPAARHKQDARMPFSLLLYGPANRVAAAGRYFLCHESLPALPPLHVMPVINPGAPADEEGRTMVTYQVIVN